MTPLLSTPSLGELSKSLEVKKSAQDDASSNKYSRNQTEPTHWEQNANAHVMTSYVKETYKEVNEFIFRKHEKLKEVDKTSLLSRLKDIPKTNQIKQKKIKADSKDSLLRAAKAKLDSEKSLRSFVLTNGLQSRKAVYPKSRVMFSAVIAVIVLLEAFLNSYFLSKGSDLGLVGGFFTALIIAVINVAIAIILGSKIRNINHIVITKKVVGYITPIIAISIAVTLALLVGHYRDTLENDPFQAAIQAVPAFLDSPFGLGNVNSWFLFGISLVAMFSAAIKSYKSDDQYPGYGEVDREYIESNKEYQSEKNKLYNELFNEIEASKKELNLAHMDVRMKCESFESDIRQSDSLVKRYKEYLDHINHVYFNLITNYRSDFKYVSSYDLEAFSSIPALSLSETTIVDVESVDLDRMRIPEIKELLGLLPEVFESTNNELNELFEHLDDEVKSCIEIIDGEVVNKL